MSNISNVRARKFTNKKKEMNNVFKQQTSANLTTMMRSAKYIHASPLNSVLYATSQNRQLYDRLILHGFYLHFRCITHGEGHQSIRGAEARVQGEAIFHRYTCARTRVRVRAHVESTSLRRRRQAGNGRM